MSLVEIQQQLRTLPTEQLQEVRVFIAELEAERFDAQLERDSNAEKFDNLIEQLEKQIASGDWN